MDVPSVGGFAERFLRVSEATAISSCDRRPTPLVLIRASNAASGGVYGQRREFQDLREIGEA
jgi:hypothetical protein